jgi:hypothetical protein
LQFYLDAFFRLSDFRGSGFSGPEPLDFISVLRYAEWVGYTSTVDQSFFVDVIRACDQVYRKFLSEKSESERKKTSGKTAGKPTKRR